MAIADDVSIDYVNKIISRDASPSSTVYSVNALYSYLMDTFDELTQMDDQIPMTAQTPTSYTMTNGWYIRENLTQFLDGGAIQTSGYLNNVHILVLDGTYAGPDEANIGEQVTDDTVDIGALLDYDNTAQKWFIRVGSATVIADDSVMSINGDAGVTGDAAGNSITGETIFANPYTLGSINGTPSMYVYQNDVAITSWWSAGHFDILIKVREGSVDIDLKAITVFAREFGELYSHFVITLTTAGQNAVPLGTSLDGNNETAVGTVEEWQDGTTSTIAVAYDFASTYSYDIGDGAGVQAYDCQIDANSQSLSNVYEVCKYWTRRTSGKQLETNSDNNFINGEAYIYADSTYSPVVVSPFGTFAGGKFFAARGIYFINLHGDDAQAFQLIDNAGNTRNPPNYQAFTVAGVISGDRVAVYEETAEGSGLVDKTQYSLSGANALNTITISVTIPADTPTTGTIIVVDDDGSEIAYAYSAYSGSDFTVTVSAALYSGTETAYVPYIYEQSTGTSVSETSTIYVSNRYVVTKVRVAGILPFVTSGTYTSTGYSATAIRTTDSQYTV
ncbi:hypothetical protein GQ473_04700 [archaeon]|nr:hypothetical protein [archaeon]